MAAAGAYWQLLFCKIFTGMGTGVCFVGGARYIHEGCAGPRLNVAQGFFGGSIQLGAGFVIFAVPQIFKLAGWRATFLVSAGMVLIAAVIWIAKSPLVEFPPSPPGKFHRHAARSAALASGTFSNGHLRHFRGCGFVGGRSPDEGHEGSRHASRNDRLAGVAPGDCVAAARRMAPTAHGDPSVVCRESPDDRAGLLLACCPRRFHWRPL